MKPSSKLYNRVIIEIKDKEISELKKENEKLLKIQKGMIKIEDVMKIINDDRDNGNMECDVTGVSMGNNKGQNRGFSAGLCLSKLLKELEKS